MKLRRGFTMVEVLVVIGIIAILTVIIFPSISNIRAKNRDAEKVADISAIQLGLALYKNHSSDGSYPSSLDNVKLKKYITEESFKTPEGGEYSYVPLARTADVKCTYYHLGTKLELPSAQIDPADEFNSTGGESKAEIASKGYYWCDTYSAGGLFPSVDEHHYNVKP